MEAVSNADLPPKETIHPPTVLHVEDDEGLRVLIQKTLKREGLYSYGVSSGAEAIAWLTSHDCMLILLDYRLPDMTGEEVIRTLKKRGLDIPFIVCTGMDNEAIAKDMRRIGALDCLVKEKTFLDRLDRTLKVVLRGPSGHKSLSPQGALP